MKVLKIILFFSLCLSMSACDQSYETEIGRTTNTLSSEFSTLEDKVTFFKRYVRLDQTYQKLDYSVVYWDNSTGGIPSPSDWDIRLVAMVLPAELDRWISGLKQFKQAPDLQWLSIIPTDIDYVSISEWYDLGFGSMVGIDREKGLVAYRNVTN